MKKTFGVTVTFNGQDYTFTRTTSREYKYVVVYLPTDKNLKPWAASWCGRLDLATAKKNSFKVDYPQSFETGNATIFAVDSVTPCTTEEPQIPEGLEYEPESGLYENVPETTEVEESSPLHTLVVLGKAKVAEFEALQQECREIKTPYALKNAQKRRAMKAAEISTLCEVAAALGFCTYDQFAELAHS